MKKENRENYNLVLIPSDPIISFSVADTDYVVEIVTMPNTYEAWLYNFNYGVKVMVIGCCKDKQCINCFIEVVEANLDEYIDAYQNEYED